MTITDAMQSRHSVRRYLNKPIPDDLLAKLNTRINENNIKNNLSIKLKINDENAFNMINKLILAKGVKNYLILCGKDTPDLDKKLGYCGSDIMLYAQALGLNTWWIGSTFNKKGISRAANDNTVTGVIALGYGATQGFPHKSKKPEEVSSYQGEIPGWFKNGVTAALLAPTALNRQAFMISGVENEVRITCDNGVLSGSDLGILKYHFEVGAGKENIVWG